MIINQELDYGYKNYQEKIKDRNILFLTLKEKKETNKVGRTKKEKKYDRVK